MATVKKAAKVTKNIQRIKSRIHRRKELEKLNQLFNMKNRNQFWKEVKSMRKNEVKVDIPTQKLKSHYEKLFNEPLMKKCPNEENDLKEAIDSKVNLIENDEETKVIICNSKISDIISNLSNNKAIGNSLISNEMLKYSLCPKLIEIIRFIMETIINKKIMPQNLNVGKIIPIPKEDETTQDINMVRPLTISDCLSNIFEYIMMDQIMKKHQVPQLQFGFRENSSCSHAIFVLTELIKHNMSLKKNTFACAIDASKAFDKVDRKSLLMKI